MPSFFLAKSDPDSYGIEHLERDRRTTWDGVRNPVALRAIRSMRPGDAVLIYHTGAEPGIVGVARVASEPQPDPRDSKLAVVDFEFVCRLEPPLALAAIRREKQFAQWALVRQPRLSTMAAPPEFVTFLKKTYPKVKFQE